MLLVSGLLVFLLWGCMVPSVWTASSRMPAELKCSACWIVARRYAKLLAETADNEETIQTGHRLNKDNKIPRKKWRESELRAMEVTEQLCESKGFKGYTIGEYNGTKYFTMNTDEKTLSKDSEGLTPNERDIPETLEKWCERMREEHEERIEKLVRKDGGAKAFRKAVCKKLTGVCKGVSNPHPSVPPAAPTPGEASAPSAQEPGAGATAETASEPQPPSSSTKDEL